MRIFYNFVLRIVRFLAVQIPAVFAEGEDIAVQIPAVFAEGEDIAAVLHTSHAEMVAVFGREYLVLQSHAMVGRKLGVLGAIVPEDRHHHVP